MNTIKKPVLVIDNYDSFTYNLVHLINELDYEAVVWRNDRLALDDVEAYDHILLSPGPGVPAEAGLLPDIIRRYAPHKTMMGVCLGQQAIAEVFGGKLLNLGRPMHGIATPLEITDPGEPLFRHCEPGMQVGRYHSWVVDPVGLPAELRVTAVDTNGQIMALRHTEYNVCGVQFHPESVLTPGGKQIMRNWLEA